MIVTTSVFFSGHGALLQDAVGIAAASFLRKSYDITDTRKRGRSTGTSTSYLAAGRPACCHSLPIYMMVDMFQAHTPWSRLIRPPIAPRMAKFGSSWKSISSLSNLLRDAGPGTASGRYVRCSWSCAGTDQCAAADRAKAGRALGLIGATYSRK